MSSFQRILALDVGSVRVGVAVSDPMGMFAQPLSVLQRKHPQFYDHIVALIQEYEPVCLVIGLPLQLDGKSGQAVASVEFFVQTLKQHVSIPIHLWDERLTTAAAQRSMIEGGARRDKRKEAIDSVAAALILQSFLAARSCDLHNEV